MSNFSNRDRTLLTEAILLIEDKRYVRATNNITRVLKRHPADEPGNTGPAIGVWIQEFLTKDWTEPQRVEAIRQAAALGCKAFALCALPVWEEGGVTDFFLDGKDLTRQTQRGIDLHRKVVKQILDAGMTPILYGWHGAQARGNGYTHLKQGNGDFEAFNQAITYLASILPSDVVWVDGVEPYSYNVPSAPPWGPFQRVAPYADYFHTTGKGEVSWVPEIHINAGEDVPQSDASGGIMVNDGGFGKGTTDIIGGRAYACLAGGGITGNVQWFTKDLVRNLDRDYYLVLFTGGWSQAMPFGREYPLVHDLTAEPWGSIFRSLNPHHALDQVSLTNNTVLLGRRGVADVRRWKVVQPTKVITFREGQQVWEPTQPWNFDVAGGPNGGTLWVGRFQGQTLYIKPVEHTLPGLNRQYMTAHHIHEIDGGWPSGMQPLKTGDELVVFLSAPAWLGQAGPAERTATTKVVWGY